MRPSSARLRLGLAPATATALLLLSLPTATCLAAGGQEAARQKLEQVRREIRALEEKAQSAGSRERSVMAEVQRLDRLAALHRQELSVITARTRDIMKKLETSDSRLSHLEERLEANARDLMERVTEVRRVSSLGYVGALLARTRRDGFLTALRHLSFLARRDRRRIEAFQARRSELERIREDLERTNLMLSRLKAESRRAEKSHRSALSGKSRLLESIRQEKVQALRLRDEMEEAAGRLQEMVGGLASAPGRLPTVPLRLYEGKLEWPVKGKVTQEFGRVGSTRFDIPYPGIDIWAPLDAPVRAVAAGTVVYADWFHGYGKTICLDHGDGYITVYSHVADFLVKPGQSVTRGQEVARVGDTGSLKGPHLYFQITKDGKPLDPRKWLRS